MVITDISQNSHDSNMKPKYIYGKNMVCSQFLSLYDHGKRITAIIKFNKTVIGTHYISSPHIAAFLRLTDLVYQVKLSAV